jgi:hypothetical protein
MTTLPRAGPMLYVSLLMEILRARPAATVFAAALVQAMLWAIVPTLFYAAPPGELAEGLAVGHEFQLGTYLGPPLAFWLAELAFRLAGLTGVYVLAQACVFITYWCIFLLGRRIAGERHAALAVLLMVGVSVFTVPTPEFGPAVLGMALWSLILMHYWRVLGDGRQVYWFILAIEVGLLLLTTYVGWVLVGLLVVFTAVNPATRAAIKPVQPLMAAVIVFVVLAPHLLWLAAESDIAIPTFERLRSAEGVDTNLLNWLRVLAGIVVAHAGIIVLIALASGWPRARPERAPVVEGARVDPFARQFVYFFAVAPSLVVTLFAALIGRSSPLVGAAPLLVLSGLAIVVAAGEEIRVHRDHTVSHAWSGLLLVPPVIAALMVAVVPWTFRFDLKVAQPARPMGHFFAESFERRTGRPLEIVAGDPHLAALIALSAPSRPRLFLDASPERSPWIRRDDIKQSGAVIIWPVGDAVGAPPADIKERFPGLIVEVPRTFERPVQGMLPAMRVGWAVIRPQAPAKRADK